MTTDPRTVKLRLLKLRAAKRWVAQQLGDIDHELRVASLAVRLYDLTQPLHGMNGFHRRMVELGAIVHDVGRAVDDRNHPEVGATMLLEEAALPLNDQERRCVAYLTRYHRGKSPALARDGVLKRTDDRRAMRVALALLKAADALDGRKAPSPRVTFSLQGRRLWVLCHVVGDGRKTPRVYCRPRKLRMLEKALGCEVSLRFVESRDGWLVA